MVSTLAIAVIIILNFDTFLMSSFQIWVTQQFLDLLYTFIHLSYPLYRHTLDFDVT